ncbi:BCCT family transporter, partial [Bacillus subtilis]|uniref:BCCT family transporter n=1 Tax=Bacillus subtilis TaxID=1423 RepID=UPI002577AAE0
MLQFVLIIILTLLFLLSPSTALRKPIKYLTNTNIVFPRFLIFFILLLPPTLLIINSFTHSIPQYIQNILQIT